FAESLRLDVSGRAVANCALVCYFVACFIGGQVDPPGTYKPCFQTGITAVHAGATAVEIELFDFAGRSLHRATRSLAGGLAGDAVLFYQVPLYSAPNVGLPAGNYRVSATLRVPSGEAAGSAALAIRID
ncbi:MAG: hypothetical protein ACRD3R_05320, partial [Terriglobales bacterium]